MARELSPVLPGRVTGWGGPGTSTGARFAAAEDGPHALARCPAMSKEAAVNRNKQQNAQNEHAGEKRPSDGKGAKNGGHGSHKATKDARAARSRSE